MAGQSQAITVEHQDEIITLQDNSKYNRKNIPIERLRELRSKGLSYPQIATLVGCSTTNVILRLHDDAIGQEDVNAFKDNEAHLLTQLRQRILSHISDDEIKKAPLATKAMVYGIAYDKYRLETGQSTANIDTQAVNVHISQLSSELDRIRKRRQQLQGLKDAE